MRWLTVVAWCVALTAVTIDAERQRHGTLPNLARYAFLDSIDDLLASFNVKSQLVQKPGLGKLLREESDRKWEDGLSYVKKYFQVGQSTSGQAFSNNFPITNVTLQDLMVEHISVDASSSSAILDFYQKMFLKGNTRIIETHQQLSKAFETFKGLHDSDTTLFIQEKSEKTRKLKNDFAIKKKILEQLINNGIGVHLFDESL